MPDHLYAINESVVFEIQSRTFSGRTTQDYTVKAQLPPLGENLQYRIKSPSEPFERVVLEHQLSTGGSAVDATSADSGKSPVHAPGR